MIEPRLQQMHETLMDVPWWSSTMHSNLETSSYRALLTALDIGTRGRSVEKLHVWAGGAHSLSYCEITLLTDRTWLFAESDGNHFGGVSIVSRKAIRRVEIFTGPFAEEEGMDDVNSKSVTFEFDGGTFQRFPYEHNGWELVAGDIHELAAIALNDLVAR